MRLQLALEVIVRALYKHKLNQKKKEKKKSCLQGTEIRNESQVLSCLIYTTEALQRILDTINNVTKLTFK